MVRSRFVSSSSAFTAASVLTPTSDGQFNVISGAGFDTSQLGTATVYNLRQYVQVAGLTHTQYGTPDTYNLRQYIQVIGFTPTQYGTAAAKPQRQYAYIAGFTATGFGNSVIEYRNRNLVAAGSTLTDFGHATVTNLRQYAPIEGSTLGNLGRPTVQSMLFHVGAFGVDSAQFGVALALNRNRGVLAHGSTFGDFGEAVRVQRGDLRPESIENHTEFGWATIRNINTQVFPFGFTATKFGEFQAECHKFGVVGLTHSEYGRPTVKNKITYVNALGSSLTQFGLASIENRNRLVYMQNPLELVTIDGLQYWLPAIRPAFGTPALTHTRITPVGFGCTQFGAMWIAGYVQYLYPEPAYDKYVSYADFISNKHRTVTPEGFDATQYGALSLSPLYLYPDGFTSVSWPVDYVDPGWPWGTTVSQATVKSASVGDTSQLGLPFVSYTPILVYPIGIASATEWGNPPYGVMHKFDQDVTPAGFNATEFGREDWEYQGTTYMHEIDYVESAGMSLGTQPDFGQAAIIQGPPPGTPMGLGTQTQFGSATIIQGPPP